MLQEELRKAIGARARMYGKENERTLASLPVVLEHEAVGTETEDASHTREAGVGATRVLVAAGPDTWLLEFLARPVVGREDRVGTSFAGAGEAARIIAAGVLARAVALVTSALVYVCFSLIDTIKCQVTGNGAFSLFKNITARLYLYFLLYSRHSYPSFFFSCAHSFRKIHRSYESTCSCIFNTITLFYFTVQTVHYRHSVKPLDSSSKRINNEDYFILLYT
jgi:hypothetical protein